MLAYSSTLLIDRFQLPIEGYTGPASWLSVWLQKAVYSWSARLALIVIMGPVSWVLIASMSPGSWALIFYSPLQ